MKIINYDKSQSPSSENCTLCIEFKNIPDSINEGCYCFEGVTDLKDADMLDENCIYDHTCNFFEVRK